MFHSGGKCRYRGSGDYTLVVRIWEEKVTEWKNAQEKEGTKNTKETQRTQRNSLCALCVSLVFFVTTYLFKPRNSSNFAPMSDARRSDSPTSTAFTPADSSFCRSACVQMPLSLTRQQCFGTLAINSNVCAKRVVNCRKSRLLMPMSVAPESMTRGNCSASCNSISTCKPKCLAASCNFRKRSPGKISAISKTQSAPARRASSNW